MAISSMKLKIADYINLTKPRIVFMVLVTTYASMVLSFKGEIPGIVITVCTLIGTGMAAAGGAAYNCYVERDLDKKMERTQNRPLPKQRIDPVSARIYAVLLTSVSLVILYTTVNVTAAFMAALSFCVYIWVYTPMKTHSSISTLAGAIPGALPTLIGWVAVSGGEIEVGGIILFSIMFLWQPPHFLALAILKRKEYANADMVMLPGEGGLPMSLRQMLLYSAALLPATFVPYRLGMAGTGYLWTSFILGIVFIVFAAAGNLGMITHRWARSFFLYSILYLAAIFGALIIDS